MSGLPAVQVLLDDGTGTFPHDVTAYARLLDGFSFTRGRDDEQAAVTAGALTLAFNNADGRFTPGSTTIDSPSPITVDQKIRVKETVNGTTFTRFTGYVKSWRVGWPAGVDTHSVVQVAVTDAQARAERRVLKSVIEEEITADGPLVHYPLSEPAGSTSATDHSGNQVTALTMAGADADVVFGNATGPGTDGLTAAEFTAGKYLQAEALGGTVAAAALCAFSTTTLPASTAFLVSLTAGVDTLSIDSTGHLLGPSGLISAATVHDGETHVAEVRYSGATVSLWLDGVEVDSAASGSAGTTISQVIVGQLFTGTIAHVALFGTDPGATRAADHASAMLTGFAGESGTARIARLAGYAGIPVGTLGTSLTNVAFRDWTGVSAWSQIADATNAEGGLSYVNGSGDLIFLNRFAAPEKVTPDLSIAASFAHFDAAPTDDDAEILNYVESTAEGTGVVQVVTDATSEGAHGRYSDSKSYLVQADAEALDRANWIVANYAEPTIRFGTLTVNLYKMTAAQQEAAIAAIAPGAWSRVTGMPAQTPGGTTVDVVVQGFTEEQTASSWSLTCNVVARSLFQAWVLGDSTYGVLGETTRLYF